MQQQRSLRLERYRSRMFRRRAKPESPSLDPRLGPDTISFDTFGWERQPDQAGVRCWIGDGTIHIILLEHFFAVPPDLPTTDVDRLRSSFETLMAEAEAEADDEHEHDGRTAQLIEVNVDASRPVVRTAGSLNARPRQGLRRARPEPRSPGTTDNESCGAATHVPVRW